MLGQKDQVTTLGGTRTPEQRRDGERARALDVELVLLEPQLVQRRQVHLILYYYEDQQKSKTQEHSNCCPARSSHQEATGGAKSRLAEHLGLLEVLLGQRRLLHQADRLLHRLPAGAGGVPAVLPLRGGR